MAEPFKATKRYSRLGFKDNKKDKVTYCFWAFNGEPQEIEMSRKDALERFNKVNASLDKNYGGTLIGEGSFVGVKDAAGNWIAERKTKTMP
jgi:hypothetical protein